MTSHATLNGTIVTTGGGNCDQRGFEWGTSPGSYPYSWTESGSYPAGAFSYVKTGLVENTHYYYRAKAHNTGGWGYGGEQNFWTWGAVSVTDSAAASDVVSIEKIYTVSVADGAQATDTVSVERQKQIFVQDSAIAVDFAWRLKGSCIIGSLELPHVLTIKITDEAVMTDKKMHPPALPKRKLQGKLGRAVEITGWTKSQTDIDNMRALHDGQIRLFIHPGGESFNVLVRDFNVDRDVDAYNRRGWRMTLAETKES